jgi:hypothetical protein
MLSLITIHLAKNPKNGGRPPRDRRENETIKETGFDLYIKFILFSVSRLN